MKNLLISSIIILLCLFMTGCKSEPEDLHDEPSIDYEELSENDLENIISDEAQTTELSATEQAVEAFLDLAWEMENGDSTTTKQRVIEVFGEPKINDEYIMDFQVTDDLGVFALIQNDAVIHIVIDPFPEYFIDESLTADYNTLRSYEFNTEGLTLEALNEYFGAKGFISAYGAGLFTYAWRSSSFEFSVDADADNNVKSAFLWITSDMGYQPSDEFEQSLLIIPNDIQQVMIDLAWEMQHNNGKILQEKVIEIIGLDYTIDSQQLIIFPVEDGVSIFAILEDTNMVEHLFLYLTKNFYFHESINAGIDDLVIFEDDYEDKTLDDFEFLLGKPGILIHYTFDQFTYIWLTPDITVQVVVDQNGHVVDFYVSQFAG